MENKDSFKNRISYKNEIEEYQKKEKMAKGLMEGTKEVEELKDEELDDMIEFFKNDIKKQDEELERIKRHILKMKKDLEG